MAFDRKAWQEAVRQGTAPRYQFEGIQAVHCEFADALISHQPFMDHYIRTVIEEILEPQNFRHYREAWVKYVEDVAHQQASEYDRRGDWNDPDGASERYDQIREEMFESTEQLAEWVRTRVVEKGYGDLCKEIRSKIEDRDDEAEAWRKWHPVIGVFSRGLQAAIPFENVVGFCPRCHETLTERALFRSSTLGGWGMECPACRVRDGVDRLEDQCGRRFDTLPFSDTPLRDVIAAVREYRKMRDVAFKHERGRLALRR